jgi:hypothetical protein
MDYLPLDWLTACVTCWRAGRGLGLGAGFRLSVEKARKCRRILPVRCTPCHTPSEPLHYKTPVRFCVLLAGLPAA